MNISKSQQEKAYMFEEKTKANTKNKRNVQKAIQDTEKIYPDKEKQETKFKKTKKTLEEATSRISRQYGEKQVAFAHSLVYDALYCHKAYDYVMAHIDRLNIKEFASQEKAAELLGLPNAKNVQRMQNEPMYNIQEHNQWSIAAHLKLNMDEAEEFRILCRTAKTEYDCAMEVCFRLAQQNPSYYEAENINRLLTHWYGERSFKPVK